MALNGFAPASYAQANPSNGAVVTVAIVGAPTNVLVTNLSPSAIGFVAFGDAVTSLTGTPVLPNESIVLTVGAATDISAIGDGSLLSFVFGD